HDALALLASELTCGLFDVPSAVTKLRVDLKGVRTQLESVRAELADLVARALLDHLPNVADRPGPIVVPISRPNDDVGALRVLAGKLATDARVIALAGGIDPSSAELVLVIQRGTSGKLDCGAFMQAQA